MIRIKVGLIFSLLIYSNVCNSQVVEIIGIVKADSDLEGIHVINKTSKFYSTTNLLGEFTIKSRLNDTLVFSSVQYKLESFLITQAIINNKSLTVQLIEHVNELNEVYIGNPLSGNLEDDISHTKGKPDINFYDVGIPGYKGKQKTKNERLLYEAGEFKPIMLLGLLGGSLPLNPILNGISGRTKMLKERVELDKKDALMYSLKAKYSKILFDSYTLSEEKQMDYFYFCSEYENFIDKCGSSNDLLVLEFLKQKLFQYKLNHQTKD